VKTSRQFIAVLVLLAFPASAQEAAASCPTVAVSCPDSVRAGQELTFTAGVSGGDANVDPTFNWTVSAGTISSGQGTSTIVVDTADAGGMTITATVDVGGFPRECSTSNSCTTSVSAEEVPATKVGEYVTRDLKANADLLDQFVLALQNDPTAQGYVIAYGGRTSRPDDAQKAADNATDYTMNTRKMDGARTLSGVGGYREEPTVELWIAPEGGTPPMATPTVDPQDVKPAPAERQPKSGTR
jgi:opacity protein-like surface antigen